MRGKSLLGPASRSDLNIVTVLTGSSPVVEEAPAPQPPVEAPPPVQEGEVIVPVITTEAVFTTSDLIHLGRLKAPKRHISAFVDYELYERIIKEPGGSTVFLQEAIETGAKADLVEILTAETALTTRRASRRDATTIGARVPKELDGCIVMRVVEATRRGVPRVSRNTITSGLVMLLAIKKGLV